MPRLMKGSDEAKQRMNHLRSLRKKKHHSTIETPSSSPSEKKEETKPKSKSNSWINHVKTFAQEHNLTYFNALKDPKIRDGYKK